MLFWQNTPRQGYDGMLEVQATAIAIKANPVPLQVDPNGTIRVVGTRLTLDTVVMAHRDGATPEEIVERFLGLSLPDAYAVVGYYLRYRREVEAYLDKRKLAAEAIRVEVEASGPPKFSRDELLARPQQK
jgi:uncharacterized protein (DUF433 family)